MPREGWDTVRHWKRKVLKWPRWKQAILACFMMIGMLVSYTIMTFDPEKHPKPILAGLQSH